MRRTESTEGFSLVELLISVIIISIGIVGFATAVGLMATELWFGRRDTEMSMAITDKVEELKAMGAANVTASSETVGDYQLSWTIVDTSPTKVRLVTNYYANDGSPRADTLITYIPD